jgi:hypothetical protein
VELPKNLIGERRRYCFDTIEVQHNFFATGYLPKSLSPNFFANDAASEDRSEAVS